MGPPLIAQLLDQQGNRRVSVRSNFGSVVSICFAYGMLISEIGSSVERHDKRTPKRTEELGQARGVKVAHFEHSHEFNQLLDLSLNL